MAGIPCLCQNGEAFEQIGADILPALSRFLQVPSNAAVRLADLRISRVPSYEASSSEASSSDVVFFAAAPLDWLRSTMAKFCEGFAMKSRL